MTHSPGSTSRENPSYLHQNNRLPDFRGHTTPDQTRPTCTLSVYIIATSHSFIVKIPSLGRHFRVTSWFLSLTTFYKHLLFPINICVSATPVPFFKGTSLFTPLALFLTPQDTHIHILTHHAFRKHRFHRRCSGTVSGFCCGHSGVCSWFQEAR